MKDELSREVSALSAKIDIMMRDIQEIKKFNMEAIQTLTDHENRISNLEKWRNGLNKLNLLNLEYKYSTRSAVIGAATSAGLMIFAKIMGWL